MMMMMMMIPLLPLCAFVACYRVNFTFTFIYIEQQQSSSCLLDNYLGFKPHLLGLSTVEARIHSFSFPEISVQLSIVFIDWCSLLKDARLETLTP